MPLGMSLKTVRIIYRLDELQKLIVSFVQKLCADVMMWIAMVLLTASIVALVVLMIPAS